MTPEEIIKIDATRNRRNAKEVRRAINTMFYAGGQLLKDSKTLITYVPAGNNLVNFDLFTADTVEGVKASVSKFVRMIHATGAKGIFIFAKNRPKFLQYLEGVFDELGYQHERVQLQDGELLGITLGA